MTYRYYVRNNELGNLAGQFCRRISVEKKALKNINFSIDEGDIVGYVGLNGAGKTTTIKILSGIIKPTTGDVKVLGYNPYEKKKDYLQKISLVMGSKTQMYWDLPAIDSIEFVKKIYNVKDQDYKTYLDKMIEILNIEKLLYKQVRRLSLGERMKMELVTALIHHPEMIFLDEPSIGLDIISQKEIRSFLKEINKEWGSTIILTSHNIDDINEVCKKLIIIDEGAVCYTGKISDFLDNYGNKEIKLTVLEDMEKVINKVLEANIHIVAISNHQLTLEAEDKQKLDKIQKIWNMFSSQVVDVCIENKNLKNIIADILTKKTKD